MDSPIEERIRIIRAGFDGDVSVAREALHHEDEHIRASALVALSRAGSLTGDLVRNAFSDPSATVRRTAVQLSPAIEGLQLGSLVDDPDLFVAEMAAWSIGERTDVDEGDLAVLIDRAVSHSEQLVREACAAALGSIGDPRGLPAILAACTDKPAVRRRAVLALAPFEGPEVDAALEVALQDRDWQVRQNAEIMLHPRG